MNEKERAEQLAAAHWEYVRQVLSIHMVDIGETRIAETHYLTAFAHGYKHAVEDRGAPLPGSARYEEIHAELMEGQKQCAECWHVLGVCPSLGGNPLGGCPYYTTEAPVTSELTEGEVAEQGSICIDCGNQEMCPIYTSHEKLCGWFKKK